MIFYQLITHCGQKYRHSPPKVQIFNICRKHQNLLFSLPKAIVSILLILYSGHAIAQNIILNVRHQTLRSVMDQVERQSGMDFWYAKNTIVEDSKISVNINNLPLKDVLKIIFGPKSLSFEIIDKTIFLKPATEKKPPQKEAGPAFKNEIIGSVKDKDGKPVPNATIKVKGTALIFSANETGIFKIDPQAESGILIVSSLGYTTLEVPFLSTDTSPFSVTLNLSENNLDEIQVVSTGYQTIPKERATGSFVQVNRELLNRRVSTNLIERLEGIVPGLIFNRNTSASSNGADISIRGHSTLFANDQPLIVLDNFPYDGDINNINPNDIESITVLKDAAAASIWGVRSGNGVIVITTKQGVRNLKLKIEANANITLGSKPNLYYNPNFLNSSEFINVEKSLYGQGYYDGDLASSSRPPISPVVEILASSLPQAEKDSRIDELEKNDVRADLEKYFYRQSLNRQYNLNFRGGGTDNNYFISGGIDNNRSNQTGNENKRITLNGLYNLSPTKKLDVSIGFNYTRTLAQNNSTVGSINSGSKGLYPYARFSDAQGNSLPYVKDLSSSYTGRAQETGLLDWNYRPLDELANADNTANTSDNRINLGVRYKIIKGLDAEAKYLYQRNNYHQENYRNEATYSTRNLINRFTQISNTNTFTYPVPRGGIMSQTDQVMTAKRVRAQVNYNTVTGMHEFSAIGGTEISDASTKSNGSTVYGYNKSTGTFSAVDFATTFTQRPAGSAKIQSGLSFTDLTDRYISYFVNTGYTYRGKYSTSLSGRIDKSNLFGVNTNQKSVPLYSAGLSWILNREKFYDLTFLPLAKFRLTYGYNGNIDKSATAVTTIRQVTNSYLSGLPYGIIANPGNPELRWEKISMLNMAFEFAIKDNRLSGSIEYYHKRGKDLFGDSQLPGSTGLTTFRGNTADTRGNGIDIVLSSKNLNNGAFNWNTDFQFSYGLDKVTRYGPKSTLTNYLTNGSGNGGNIFPLEGKPLFAIYSYKWAGLDPANGNPRGYLNGIPSSDYARIIAETPLDSLVYNGTSRPKFFGSLRNTFNYGPFSISANLIYKLGYFFKRSSIEYSSLYGIWSGHSDYSERWQKPGDELNTNVPSEQPLPVNTPREGFYLRSEALVSRGDHIRLQDINLSYSISKKLLRNTPFGEVQVYCYLNNVGIIWRANHHGLDPDLFGSALPIPRTWAFGIKTQL
jgi:TonB-linked SusC/RagA family outer membrane protein